MSAHVSGASVSNIRGWAGEASPWERRFFLIHFYRSATNIWAIFLISSGNSPHAAFTSCISINYFSPICICTSTAMMEEGMAYCSGTSYHARGLRLVFFCLSRKVQETTMSGASTRLTGWRMWQGGPQRYFVPKLKE